MTRRLPHKKADGRYIWLMLEELGLNPTDVAKVTVDALGMTVQRFLRDVDGHKYTSTGGHPAQETVFFQIDWPQPHEK